MRRFVPAVAAAALLVHAVPVWAAEAVPAVPSAASVQAPALQAAPVADLIARVDIP